MLTALVLMVEAPRGIVAQTIGKCGIPAAQVPFNVGNINALVRPSNGLFGNGTYEQPAGARVGPLWAANIWLAGIVDGEIAGHVGTFNNSSLWMGPVYPGLQSPDDCADFDRLYKINREDILLYEGGEPSTTDLAEWPTGLGAPTIDPDGYEIVLQADGVLAHVDSTGSTVREEMLSFEERLNRRIDLRGGERPKLVGDQMIWWVMNDLGAVHTAGMRPLGMEVHASVFGFDAPGTLGNLSFYRFRFLYKGPDPIRNAFVSVYVDSDLGHALDDYVGVDTTSGLGYQYNARDDDAAYGAPAPAFGLDFFQGPVADPDGIDNDRDGETDGENERLQMTSFIRVINRLSGGQDWENDPTTKEQYYNYMRGLWRDGANLTVGGKGRDFSPTITKFAYPGRPEAREYWSEINVDDQGTANIDNDRRFVVSSGPFGMNPNETEEIIFGFVWSRGDDYLNSVQKLRQDDQVAQRVFDLDFDIAPVPAAPVVTATPLDGRAVLEWTYSAVANNYLDGYREIDRLLPSEISDNDYTFEGYNVYRFDNQQDQEGQIIAVYDVANGVRRVIDGDELTFVAAEGRDSGVQHHHVIDELTNYQTYHFGVQAYAYNAASTPRIYPGPIARVEVVPTRIDNMHEGTVLNADFGTEVSSDLGSPPKGQEISVRIANPVEVTGHTYEVRFYDAGVEAGVDDPKQAANYDIVDLETGGIVFDGLSSPESLGRLAPRGRDVLLIEGLSWTVSDYRDVLTLQGSALSVRDGSPAYVQIQGVGDNDACGPGAGATFGCTEVGGNGVYANLNGALDWLMFQFGEGPESSLPHFAPRDFEIRVTDAGSYGYYGRQSKNAVWVPFEVWDIGSVGAHGVNDPFDDVQLIPVLFADSGVEGECRFGFGELEDFLPNLPWPVSDRAYAYYPTSGSTYKDWAAAVKPLVDAAPDGCATGSQTEGLVDFLDGFPDRGPLQNLVWLMNPNSPNYRDEMIPVGNVIRLLTTKPFEAGETYTINTSDLAPTKQVREAMRLDQIGVVPNPYRGASDYEISQSGDEVRFTNLPEEATIRVFDLAGSLLRVMEKRSPESYFTWNLQTETGLPIASGIYLIHVEVPGVGEHAFKFGVVRKRTQLLELPR